MRIIYLGANLRASSMLCQATRTQGETMARSQAEKAESRAKILRIAGSELRARGLDGVGVAELMSAAGMTHGGFYKHFESRDHLVEAAISALLQEVEDTKAEAESKTKGGSSLESYIDWYLSDEHRDKPGEGCPISTLGIDMSRAGDRTRSVFTQGLVRFVEWIVEKMPAGPARRRQDRAALIASALVGGLVLARASSDPDFSEHILSGVRKELKALG